MKKAKKKLLTVKIIFWVLVEIIAIEAAVYLGIFIGTKPRVKKQIITVTRIEIMQKP